MLYTDKDAKASEVFTGQEQHLLYNIFNEAGITESRWSDLKEGLVSLHKAFSRMDISNQKKFFKIFKERNREVKDGVFALLAMTGIAEDLRWEFEEEYYS
jgi:hypothetical protein